MSTSSTSARRRALTTILAVLCLLATACGGNDDSGGDTASESTEPSSSEEVDPVDAADRDGEFRFAYSTGVNSFDPHKSPTFSGDQLYQRQVYDRLLTLERNDEGEVELAPQLATEYSVAEDGLSLEFTLREDVTFQDDTPFDADVVVANLERAMEDDSTVASLLSSVESVEAVDEYTAVINLSQPDPSVRWLMATNTTGMMASPEAFDQLETDPVGTGPFTLVSAEKEGDVIYERWDDHWDPDAALVQRIVYSTISDQNARYNAVQSGELDAAFISTPLDAEARSLEDDGYHWVQALSPVSVGLMTNTDMEPFDDPEVRKAIYMAIDREEISEELVNGINPPVYQPFAEGFMGHDPDLVDPDVTDVETARQMIEDAGATGASVEMIQPQSQPQDTLAEVMQQVMNDLGLEVELLPISPTEARPQWREGGDQAMVAPIIGQIDPASTLSVSYLSSDNPAEVPQELSDMASQAAELQAGSDEQAEAYQEISRYLVEENPIHIPVFQFSTVILTRPEVVGSDNLMVTGIADLNFRRVGVTES